MAEYRNDTYHLFIDFKAAYDSTTRVKLYDDMSSFGIPAKLIRLVRMTMTNVTCQVMVDGKLSGPFATTKGPRRATWRTIFYKSTQILAYANDIDIIVLRLSYVAEAYQGIEQAAENLGLQINEAKTKLMVATSAGPPTNNQNLRRRDVQKQRQQYGS